MLEASLRRLVREEAVEAALGTIEPLGQQIAQHVRDAAQDQFGRLAAALDHRNRSLWTAPGEIARQPVPIDLQDGRLLADCRARALNAAVAMHGAAEPEQIVETALTFARFILDGAIAERVA